MALPKKIELHMKPIDINAAICNSRTQCAIARNIYRELEIEVGRVRVSTAGVSIAKEGYRYYYRVPKRACRLVADFDAHKHVEPIHFALRFTNRTKIAPVPLERKQQINDARTARTATLLELGQRPKQYPKGRYGI
jgi:hypothetical protein